MERPIFEGRTSGGLRFVLSEGSEQPANQPLIPVAVGRSLTASEGQQVLDRLPPLLAEGEDVQDFSFPTHSLPPPRTGETVEETFPPPVSEAAPVPPPAGPLEVLRFQPDGDIGQAPYLSVTFSQPMVAVTSHADLAVRDVPVQLSPQPVGGWRWVGTKTLLFEPEFRFPMATRYTATVPEGTNSAIGDKLENTVTWEFATPPPQVQSSYPNGGPHRRDMLMFAVFDQRIDPHEVLATLRVEAAGATYPVRLATDAEVEADETVRHLAKSARDGRWLAFRAEHAFPADAKVLVTIGPGTPSAEGPLKTEAPQSFGFRTYGPLRVVQHRCGWRGECPPFTPWSIRFSNPLDADAFQSDWVQIEPEVPGLKVAVNSSSLTIRGSTKGRTTYTVTLAPAIQDVFGQTLGTAQTLTFSVTSAKPRFQAAGGNFIVLDPTARPAYSVFTINYERLDVQVYAVEPQDWQAVLDFRTAYSRYHLRPQGSPPTPPGRRVLSRTIDVNALPDELVETAIDLSPALEGRFGQLLVLVEAKPGVALIPWVQVTQIGLDAFVDGSEMLVWVNSLVDGSPLEGVELSLLPTGKTATTDDTGITTLPLDGTSNMLVARKGRDLAILLENFYAWGGRGWQRWEARDTLRWFVFDDRQMYRPGEEVHVKGWIRHIGGGKGGDLGALRSTVSHISYRLVGPQRNEILKGEAQPNLLGGFDLAFKLPEGMNLGRAQIELDAVVNGDVGGTRHRHPFQVQEFRRPEFEVSAGASEGPHFVGRHTNLSVTASYLAGGPLPDAEVTWRVMSSAGHFTPPNWDHFTFGTWVPWWRSWVHPSESQQVEIYAGRTNASGTHHLRIDFDAADPPRATSVRAEASVMDVNRQAWTAGTNLLVHPAELYVGLRSQRTFVERGEPLEVDAIVVDLDGNPVSARTIDMRSGRLDWTFKNGSWQQEVTDPLGCELESTGEPVQCTFETKEGGTYRITATILDESGRKNQSELTLWVSGGQRPSARNVEQEEVTLVPDRKEYQPGEVAEVLVQTPFYPAEGLLTLRRSGIVHSERFTMDGPSHTLNVAIEESYIPNVYVQVDLVGSAPRTDDGGKVQNDLPQRPAFASGSLNLSVPPLSRTLSVEVTPRDRALEPGGETVVGVLLKDASGQPVEGGELAVWVVDEAVLALTGYQIPDPIGRFYSQRGQGVRDHHLRSNILLAAPALLLDEFGEAAGQPVPATAPTARGDAAEPETIRVRTDFNALAVFAPAVPTNAEGRAQVKVTLPDNLTRYRVMAVAVAGEKQFGAGESTIRARLPLMVRPSPPRFLNFGDRFELPVVVQNQTDEAMEVEVAVQATNVELTGSAGKRVTVPANDRVEVLFPVATVSAGTARFQVGAVSGSWADAAQFELPVWTPATTEAFATYGQIDAGAIVQPVVAPDDTFVQFGGLEITTSATALQALTDAVLYLVSYPFEGSEQVASRILAVAGLRDVLTVFEAEGLPDPESLVAAVEEDIEKLRGMQNPDGGFSAWRRGRESWPFHTIHVAHALARARQKGFTVPEEMLDRSLLFLRDIQNRIPRWYGKDVHNSLIAYVLYVRHQAGDTDAAGARSLINDGGLEQLSPEAVGWLLTVLSDDPESGSEVAAIRRYLNNRVTETAGAAHFATSYREGDGYLLLDSNRRADGIILEAMMLDQPDSDLIPKLVQGLLAHRTRGRWGNTQENAFILLALDRYFNTYEAQTPDFVARVWLGDQFAGEHAFRGRTTERSKIAVPMSYLAASEGPQALVLAKEGDGRLYYRLGMRYAPTDLFLEPADHGFTVERVYEAVDDPDDVRQEEDGTWHVKGGARVRVRLTMVAPTRRYHVALVDPLPAGLETLNPDLAITGGGLLDPESPSSQYSWWGRWYQHQNLRDERTEAFTSLLRAGVYTYSYVARATTPGEFIVPPPKAEEMYAPETFGRGASDRVIVFK